MKCAFFNHGFELALPADCVTDCSHQGACDDDVAHWVKQPIISEQLDAIDASIIRDELAECGAWDDEQLDDDDDNRERILWIAACNIREEQ